MVLVIWYPRPTRTVFQRWMLSEDVLKGKKRAGGCRWNGEGQAVGGMILEHG